MNSEIDSQASDNGSEEEASDTDPPAEAGDASDVRSDIIAGPTQFVLGRELYEIHLLLDFLSGHPGKNLFSSEGLAAFELDEDWISRVCQINWPPNQDQAEQAGDAALLIKVKNHLNSRAYPASGATIAFTLLVAQEDNATPEEIKCEEVNAITGVPSRISLARRSYPGLVSKAQSFRTWMTRICIFLLLSLTLTCLLSWLAASGNARMAQIVTAERALADAEARLATHPDSSASDDTGQDVAGTSRPAPNAPAQTTPKPKPPVSGALASGAPASGERPADGNRHTARQTATSGKMRANPCFPIAGSPLPPDLAGQQLCANVAHLREELDAARRNLADWTKIFRPMQAGTGTSSADETRTIAAARSNLSVLGTAILPVLYGILGAAAAVLRTLSAKVRASLLSPRDVTLSLQQLALGAVVGACIGLFVSTPGQTDPQGINLFGPITLSSSALSFVAGFGVESVFSALEALLGRMFNSGQGDVSRPPT